MLGVSFTSILIVLLWILGYYGLEIYWITTGVLVLAFRIYITSTYNQRILLQTQNNLQVARKLSWLNKLPIEEDGLNRIFQLLWPKVANLLEKTIKEEIEPLIKQSSGILSNLTFSNIDLGTIAPQFQIIGIYEEASFNGTEIIIDANVFLKSDCNIEVKANRLTAGIRDLTVQGVVRVSLCSVSNTRPIIGAITFSFIDDPVITYDLTQLANLFDLPGVDKVFQFAVNNSIKSLLVLPRKVCFQFKPDLDMNLIKFPMPKGVLHIQVIGAHNLKQKQRKQKFFMKKFTAYRTDAYTVVKVGSFQARTKAIDDSFHPMWNEAFTFLVYDIMCSQVQFTIYDDDGPLKKNSFLGSVLLPVKTAYERGVVDQLIPLSTKDNSKLHVRLEWLELSDDPTELAQARRNLNKNGLLFTALLSIFVFGAEKLMDYEEEVQSYLTIDAPGEEIFKTKTSKSSNPVWKENFQIFVTNPEDHYIWFQVFDSIKKTSIGELQYFTANLLNAPNMVSNEPLYLYKSGSSSLLNVKLSLRILQMKPDRQLFKIPSGDFLTASISSFSSTSES